VTSKPIPDPGFAGDEGEPDPLLAQALRSYDAGRCGDDVVLATLVTARLLVPVTAVPIETTTTQAGLTHDKKVDMALPVMVGADGRRALPAFTSLAALAAWNPQARPVPMPASRAAIGALQEDCAFLVLDPAGPVTWVADRPQIESLAATHPPHPTP
jgi:hypothetical protein